MLSGAGGRKVVGIVTVRAKRRRKLKLRLNELSRFCQVGPERAIDIGDAL
jgi:hypothetical protein